VKEALGFKALAVDTWDHPDEIMWLFATIGPTGVRQLGAADWAGRVLGAELDPGASVEIQKQFAIACGMLVYGWLFYPLYTQALAQLLRVLEGTARWNSSRTRLVIGNHGLAVGRPGYRPATVARPHRRTPTA
jgi:hypothetical protein